MVDVISAAILFNNFVLFLESYQNNYNVNNTDNVKSIHACKLICVVDL